MTLNKALLLAATMATVVFGAALNGTDECGSIGPSEELLAVARQMQIDEAAEVKSGNSRHSSKIVVPTYVHVVASGMTKEQGYLLDVDVKSALADANKAYKDTDFQFDLKTIDYIIKPEWATGKDQIEMRRLMHQGDYKTLNLWFIPELKENGNCYLPESDPFLKDIDGCVLRSNTHDNKQTTPHEIGHWLGLFHTFEGGCNYPNDMVDDTPAHLNTWSCDPKSDTCPSLPGKDPVTNIMSYGDCRSEFTPGQIKRMASMYNKFRA